MKLNVRIASSAVIAAACLMALPFSCLAKPRPPGPPFPEPWRLFDANFDEPFRAGVTNLSAHPQYSDYVESWSGYALNRSGSSVTAYTIPALNANGQTNVGCSTGALRFWIAPYWASQSQGGTGPGSQAQLVQMVFAGAAQAEVAWSIGVSPDGSALLLNANLDGELTNILTAQVAWQASQWHCVTLNYGPDFSELFVDGQLAGESGGLPAVPPAASGLIIGSDFTGRNVAGAQFEEVSLFWKPMNLATIQFYYTATSQTAAKGPISDQPVSAKNTLSANSITAMSSSDAPPSPGGGGGGGGSTNVVVPPAFMTNSGLCLLPPVFVSSNVVVLTATNTIPGAVYDLYAITNLILTNWCWVMRGNPGQTNFTVLTAPNCEFYFQLGTLLDTDGDGLPDAYECLVSKTAPNSFTVWSKDGVVPDGWYLAQGINPLAGFGSMDPDLDGLSNQFEYLWGTNPWASEGVGVWASVATAVCGLP